MRVLVTGWASFLHGEATAGDVASMRAVASRLGAEGIDHDVVWSPVFDPRGLSFDDAPPEEYTHVIFACGPVHGRQLEQLHERYARCIRIAVGVSVIDPEARAVAGFHRVLPRDGPGLRDSRDLAARPAQHDVPVVGVVLAPGQPEYAERSSHGDVHDVLQRWLVGLDCARVPLDTRLGREWQLCGTPEAFAALISRTDVVVTTRLHGLVFALSAGVPALAVDPVAGGGKVTAQAGALEWPVVLRAEEVTANALDRALSWCRSTNAADRAAAFRRSHQTDPPLLDALARELHAEAVH